MPGQEIDSKYGAIPKGSLQAMGIFVYLDFQNVARSYQTKFTILLN